MLFLIFGDERNKKLYDDSFDEGYLIEKFADQSYFSWFKVKKVAIVSARDFVIILHFNISSDGTMFCLAFDANNKDLVPEIKGLVRASIPVCPILYLTMF